MPGERKTGLSPRAFLKTPLNGGGLRTIQPPARSDLGQLHLSTYHLLTLLCQGITTAMAGKTPLFIVAQTADGSYKPTMVRMFPKNRGDSQAIRHVSGAMAEMGARRSASCGRRTAILSGISV